MKQNHLSYLVVLGAANVLLMAGCGGSNGGGGTTTTPTPTPSGVSVSVARAAVIGENSVKAVLSGNVTVTNANGSDTAYTCASSNANLVTINDAATCTFTSATTGSGDATITVTAHADNAKTATFIVHVGNYVLVEGEASGLQIVDAGKTGATPVTLMTGHHYPCIHSQWERDYQRFICADASTTTGQTALSIYQTDGTAAGTTKVNSMDFATAALGGFKGVDFPIFSLDGTKIIFNTQAVVNNQAQESIYIVNADGKSAPTLVVQEPPSGVALQSFFLTPDGKQVLYQNIPTMTVYAVNLDGSNPHQFIAAPSITAIWSPDMKTLYYTNYSGGSFHLYVANADGNVQKTLDGYNLQGVSPNGAFIGLTNYTNVYIADASGNVTSTPLVPTAIWIAW